MPSTLLYQAVNPDPVSGFLNRKPVNSKLQTLKPTPAVPFSLKRYALNLNPHHNWRSAP